VMGVIKDGRDEGKKKTEKWEFQRLAQTRIKKGKCGGGGREDRNKARFSEKKVQQRGLRGLTRFLLNPAGNGSTKGNPYSQIIPMRTKSGRRKRNGGQKDKEHSG